jgi:hypothetical protein
VFADLYEQPDMERLPIFESTPGFREIIEFNWDTSLPELDEPWPHHMPEGLNLRQMVSMLTGRPDVTTYLYELRELEEYERSWGDDLTAVMEAVSG